MSEEEVKQDMVPPVSVDEIIGDQEVINSGRKNDGVVKYENYIIFVNDCEKGDIVSFKMTKVLPKFGIGEKIGKEEE